MKYACLLEIAALPLAMTRSGFSREFLAIFGNVRG